MIDLDLDMLPRDAPPIPDRDLWWDAVRRNAPEGDFTTRHRRGTTLVPNGASESYIWRAEAYVCCDPACGGVELGEHTLWINHGCCNPFGATYRRHMVGLGRVGFTGYYHGPFTAWWEPAAVLAGGAR